MKNIKFRIINHYMNIPCHMQSLKNDFNIGPSTLTIFAPIKDVAW
jgi:hypothetical protein